MLYNIDYHVTDRCNKKCVSCGHFIPLVPKNVKYKSLDVVEEDFKALARFPGLSQHLSLTGGECTLHPQLKEILEMAIKYFPDTQIRIVSNGTNPDRLIELKDIVLAHDNVSILLTNYNSENTTKIGEAYDCKAVQYFVVPGLDEDERTRFNKAFFCGEKCTTMEQAQKCHYNTECIQLVDKKLYACQYLAYFNYFEDYFKDQMKLRTYGDEGIELDKCTSNKEIEDFICNWIQNLCFYCLDGLRNDGKYKYTQELTNTGYKLEEWYIKTLDELKQTNEYND